ncbi:MAG: hypothetical protein JXR41_00995 [Bacteroidales bacterium]|nr:hypothetical protein [Bacteroidales bacterium]
MNKFFLITLYCLITATTLSQPLPDGYILLYQQSFSTDAALKDFRFSCQDAWIIKGAKENRYLEFSADTTYITAFRSPMILGIMSQHIFGDFILEADLMQTGREYERRDMCIFFSVRDSSHYYYIHLASQSSDSSHGIFLVKNGPRYKVSDWQTEGMSWGNEKWHKVRVERNIVTRMVSVYVDDMKKPVMTTRNPELVMGYLGFGSFDDSGRIDNIKIWGPTSIPEEADFFEVKK